MRFIGDVHGKFQPYKNIIRDCEASIQVGDMGVGFKHYNYVTETYHFSANPPYDHMERGNHRYIRGNHDNPSVCKTMKHWIPDGHSEENMFFVGGATSIDKAWRTPEIDWWEDEEVSYSDWEEIFTKYEEVKPEILVTHECPDFLAEIMMALVGSSLKAETSMTRKAIDTLYSIHRPKLHFFGHWHVHLDTIVEGTNLICLPELGFVDVDLNTLEISELNFTK